MQKDTIFSGERVSYFSFNGRLRRRLHLPCKQLYFYPDIDKNEKEEVISWKVVKKLKTLSKKNKEYEISITTPNRTISIATPFLVWMQKPNFWEECQTKRV